MFERRCKNRIGSPKAGFTLVEMTISLVVMAVGFSAFLGVALESMRDFEFYTKLNLVAQWNQQIINDIRKDCLSTKRYFSDDAEGQSYFAALDFTTAPLPVDSLRLPWVDEAGTFDVDTLGNEKTGNALFCVKALPLTSSTFNAGMGKDFVTDFTVVIGMDPEDTATYRINAYRFVVYYLNERISDSIGRHPDSLDLIRWASVPVLDYGQVMAVQETFLDVDSGITFFPRQDLVSQFVTSYNSNFIWHSNEDVDNSFYFCSAAGIIDALPDNPMTIPQDPVIGVQSMLPGGMRNGRQISVCYNAGTPNFQAGPVVPMYALANGTGAGFPHGFEVQIVGPSGARELLMRLALAKEGAGRIIAKDFKTILTTRDY
jgi:prepilin-type N-terminal cleavage/methylation domain-containing protein